MRGLHKPSIIIAIITFVRQKCPELFKLGTLFKSSKLSHLSASISEFQLVELLLAMYEELGLLDELRIPREVLKKFLVRYVYSIYSTYCSMVLVHFTPLKVRATRKDFLHKQRWANPPDFHALSSFEFMRQRPVIRIRHITSFDKYVTLLSFYRFILILS